MRFFSYAQLHPRPTPRPNHSQVLLRHLPIPPPDPLRKLPAQHRNQTEDTRQERPGLSTDPGWEGSPEGWMKSPLAVTGSLYRHGWRHCFKIGFDLTNEWEGILVNATFDLHKMIN
jgi:hypothetical protein